MGEPDAFGKFGDFGGRFVPESLIFACQELEDGFRKAWADRAFHDEFEEILSSFGGRPTPITYCARLSLKLGVNIYLKREDLAHTGSHKINNVIGQALLAKRMGKHNLIAETGAGQHGVASATAAALMGMKCKVYMGAVDIGRQALNVFRMRLLGAEVISVESGAKTLKDAVNDAMRAWVSEVETTHYCLGSVMGPHPYPWMVREFQSIIGKEASLQWEKLVGKSSPDYVVACVGGGSNAAGTFAGFAEATSTLIGVEAAGGAALSFGIKGVVHGMASSILQDEYGQINEAHSISAGLDYPGVGPEHAYLAQINRAKYVSANDSEVLMAFKILSQLEGIIPALESAHGIAWVINAAKTGEIEPGSNVLVTLSGRGDKDVAQVSELLGGFSGAGPGLEEVDF
ncbi:MAG: tryptophan synthase subunit beta [Acidimicrobiales bacterium]|nr:tryptophan synthase subunit beta [Acidimicrobiales bacterium]